MLTGRIECRSQVEESAQRLLLQAVCHDIRGPLSVIVSYAECLKQSLERDGRRSELACVESIVQAVDQIDSLANDLAGLAGPDEGQPQFSKEPIDLAIFFSSLLERYAAVGWVPRVVAEIPSDDCAVLASRNHLERIFMNLISNALKYSPAAASVTVKAKKAGRVVFVTIADSGDGIPPEELPHIFDHFFRGKNTGSHEGLGLGLYIAKMLVAAHGGRIWAESESGRGSSIHFTIPCAV